MPNTFLDELARLNSQNFLGGLTQIGEAVKEIKQNEAVNDLYNTFRVKSNELRTTEQQISELNAESIDFTKPDAATKFAELSANATANLNKILNMSESYGNMYQPFITAFATLGDEGVQIANSLSRELEGKQQLLEQRGKLPLMQVEQEFNKLQYGKAVRENLMDEFKFDKLKTEYARNESASQLEGIIRLLPEYNNMPDMATVHSSQKLAVFNQIKNSIKDKALAMAKERGINVSPEIADLAFQKTLSEDKKLVYSELKPSDYPVNQQGQAEANYKNTYDMYGRFMETATHMYSNVYNSAAEDEKSLLIRGALEKLRDSSRGGRVNASLAPGLVESGEMSKTEYDALFNSQDGFYTVFSPGGLYDQAQSWMSQNVMGWNNLTDKGGAKLPSVPGTENIMRYKGSGAAINFDGAWVHNPAEIRRQRQLSEAAKAKAVEEANKKSMIPKGDKLPYQPYSWMKYE